MLLNTHSQYVTAPLKDRLAPKHAQAGRQVLRRPHRLLDSKAVEEAGMSDPQILHDTSRSSAGGLVVPGGGPGAAAVVRQCRLSCGQFFWGLRPQTPLANTRILFIYYKPTWSSFRIQHGPGTQLLRKRRGEGLVQGCVGWLPTSRMGRWGDEERSRFI